MTMNRWKLAACTLTLGVGGLAVFATDETKKTPPKDVPPSLLPTITVKPNTPASGADTPSGPVKITPTEPAKTAAPVLDFDLEVPSLPASTKPSKEPIFVPVDAPMIDILPVKAEADTKKEPAPKVPEPAKKETPKPTPAPTLEIPSVPPPVIEETEFKINLPKSPKATDTPPAPEVKKPEPPKVPVPSPPSVKIAEPLPPPVNVAPTPPLISDRPLPPVTDVKPVHTKPVETAPTARLKMTLRMGDGKPRFEIRNSLSDEILLKVYGEKIEMAAPQDGRPSSLAGVSAIGRVKFTAPGLEGTCDHLTILSGSGEVLMKGNIQLKTKRGRSWSEMTAEKMVYQIGTTGLSSPTAPRNPVTPASYIPD